LLTRGLLILSMRLFSKPDRQGRLTTLTGPCYKQQWNLTVEREILAKTGLRVSYIGTKDTQLGYQRHINRPPKSTTPFTASRAPYPNLVDVIAVENGGNDSYNALDVAVTRPLSRGLQFKSGWVWAKSLSDVAMSRFENEVGNLIEDPYDRRRERGNGDFVPRHKWVTEFVWDVPFGRGKKYLNGASGAVNQVLGGVDHFWLGRPSDWCSLQCDLLRS